MRKNRLLFVVLIVLITSFNITQAADSEITLTQGWNLFSPIIEPNESGTDRDIPLKQGWNMFGCSSQTNFDWINNAQIDNLGDVRSITDAALAGWLQSTIYYYEDGTYKLIPGNDDYLRRDRGYWLYAFEDNLTLTLPGVGGSLIDNSFHWMNAQIDNGTTTKSITEAQESGWLQGTIYYFDEDSQYYKFIPGDGNNIYPWRGYWLYANGLYSLLLDTSPPIANFTMTPPYAIGHANVTFNASLSYDEESEISEYLWDFDDDGIIDKTGEITTNEFSICSGPLYSGYTHVSPGPHDITLTVINGGGLSSSKTQEIRIYGHVLDMLMVEFNGQTNDGVTATTKYPNGSTNTQFQQYFSDDLDSIATQVENVTDINIEDWYTINWASIKIYYESISDIEMQTRLDEIKTILYLKWYSDYSEYNSVICAF